MIYTLKTTDKATIPVTKEQRNRIGQAIDAGKKHIFINDNLIMVNAITGIYVEEAHEQNVGYLHDGTKVFKQFGEWKDANNPHVRLDRAYYPEIAEDRVMTPNEWKNRREGANLPAGDEIKQLPESIRERKAEIMAKSFDNATPVDTLDT